MPSPLPANSVVWIEMPVADMARAQGFYAAVLDNPLGVQDEGHRVTANFPSAPGYVVGGHLMEGKPAEAGTGTIVHLAAPKPLDATLRRVTGNGGVVVSEIIEIPDGQFAYCQDPDGNTFGLFVG